MQKTLTLFFFVVLLILSAQPGSAQKAAVKAKPKQERASVVGDKPTIRTSKSETPVAEPRLITIEFIKMMAEDPDYIKNVVVFSEKFALDYNPLTAKTEETLKMLAVHNSKLSASDIIVSYLPRIAMAGSTEETVANYHSHLELLLNTYPTLLPSLGEEFGKAFQDQTAFYKAVKEAMEKGHSTNL